MRHENLDQLAVDQTLISWDKIMVNFETYILSNRINHIQEGSPRHSDAENKHGSGRSADFHREDFVIGIKIAGRAARGMATH